MLMLRRQIILFTSIALFTSLNLQAANQCENLFTLTHQKENVGTKISTQFLKAAYIDNSSTTAARVEVKYTINKKLIGDIIGSYKAQVETKIPGYRLESRDAKTPGYKNVTWTGYSNRFNLKPKEGKSLTAKIRVRKYGLISDADTVSKDNFLPLSWMKDISFFEFKIENPEYENSVLKPRVIIKDSDANMLIDPNLTNSDYQAIIQRTLELNKKKDPVAEKIAAETSVEMIETIRLIHKNGKRFAPEFETLYERTSYVIPIIEPISQAKLDIQITIDENISTYSNLQNKASTAYSTIDPVSVVEIKIPIPLLKEFKDEASAKASAIPGIYEAYILIERLKFNSLKSFQDNSGKLFHTRKNLEPSAN